MPQSETSSSVKAGIADVEGGFRDFAPPDDGDHGLGATVPPSRLGPVAGFHSACRKGETMITPSFPDLHSDCDLAAMVYGAAAEPDDLLRDFLDRRIAQGHDALGVVQSGRPRISGRDRVPTFDLLPRFEWPGGSVMAPNQRPDGCRSALDRAARSLADILPRNPDVLVLNRFGRAEAGGAGFLGLLATAVLAEIPVLIAVPEALFPLWLRLTGGMTVRVGPSREGLDSWWTSLGHGKADPRRFTTACERFK